MADSVQAYNRRPTTRTDLRVRAPLRWVGVSVGVVIFTGSSGAALGYRCLSSRPA